MIKELTFEEIQYYWKKYLWAKYTTRVHKIDVHTQKNYFYRFVKYLTRDQIDEWFNPTYIGYVIDDKIVGVESGYKSNKDYYRLRGLWVNDDYRGQGIATKLLKYLEIRSSEKYLWSCPRESALDFYLKYGFKVTGLSEITLYGQNYFAVKEIEWN
jgi:GNAT superfamily N-acetyltransferase